jgi:hypothetical protein
METRTLYATYQHYPIGSRSCPFSCIILGWKERKVIFEAPNLSGDTTIM